jgi:hypothetical protein
MGKTVTPQIGEIWNSLGRDYFYLILEREGDRVRYMFLNGPPAGKTLYDNINVFSKCKKVD